MSPNPPSRILELPPDPRSAGQARRWMREQLTECDHAELIDAATLAVSELVANAVIHARTQIWVELRLDGIDPRVEVRDLSPRRLRPRPVVSDALRHTGNNGNGISMIAAVTKSWGVEPWGDNGKAVWFVPISSDEEWADPVALVEATTAPAPQTAPLDVFLLDAPVELLWQSRMYYRDLRREIMLLKLQPELQRELSDELVHLIDRFGVVNPVFLGDEQILDRAYVHGDPMATLHYQTRQEERADCLELTILFDRAELFCLDNVLLTLPPPEEYVAVRHWQFDEFVRQIDGNHPISWADASTRQGTDWDAPG